MALYGQGLYACWWWPASMYISWSSPQRQRLQQCRMISLFMMSSTLQQWQRTLLFEHTTTASVRSTGTPKTPFARLCMSPSMRNLPPDYPCLMFLHSLMTGAEVTNTRVAYYSIFALAVCLFSAAFQM